MKIIITESQFYDLIPTSVRRRMTGKDFQILDDTIRNNKRYCIAQDFDRYLDCILRDSLNEFIYDYKIEIVDQDLDVEKLAEEERIVYKIFWELIPFLKKKYHDLLYDYHREYNNGGRIRSINESQYINLFNDLPASVKRRITQEDLDFLDDELSNYINKVPPFDSFEYFSNYIIGDLLHDFVIDRKADETSRDNIFDLYWKLMPVLKERYRDRMYRSWKKRRDIY